MIVLIKESFSNHREQLRIIFDRLCAAGLKANSPKFSFGLNCIPSLCCVITQEDIKPDPNKLQGIMDIGITNIKTDEQALIVMVYYCRYI